MKPDKAKELIKDTFENPFDKDRFDWFLKNLFPDKIEARNKVYTGAYIKEAYRPYIRKYEQIGKYIDDEGSTIDLLTVELLKGQSIARARVSQRNFIASYLKNKNHREGALVAFYSDGTDEWRFSLIRMEYSLEKKKDELSPAKRLSFLVGGNEKSHTAQKQLSHLLSLPSPPTLQEIEAAFNIETVTKEFFEKYKELFLVLNDHIEKEIKKSKILREELESKNIDAVSFTKKLLGQIVFLYFLQKKGWLGVPKNENWGNGDKKFLRSLLDKANAEKKNFFSDYLVYLFYEALATERRGSSDGSYYKKLDCRIPFLNGGLFEADYAWQEINIDIPNKFFTNKTITKENDEGDGILNVFDRYNFTVKEDEPLDKEVAVDPEMLGKVFENLLEVKDRKSKGAFYTPREIVHYMCQESLIAYLETSMNKEATSFLNFGESQVKLFGGNKGKKGQLGLVEELDKKAAVPKADIEKLIREGSTAIDHDEAKEAGGLVSQKYALPKSIRENAEALDSALANIRICDPAIGSGAFPVGMMNEIIKARETLTTYLKDGGRTPYDLKRHAIQECIYGVDIDHSAIDIAKLRLWLSLVVDEEDFHKIKPLPNLDYKIVCGNSLVGFPFKTDKYDASLKKIEKLKSEYFASTDLIDKRKLRIAIDSVIKPLYENSSKTLGYRVDFDFELAFSEVFHLKGGFDLFIGNPPYLEARSKEFTDELKEKIQLSTQGRWKDHSKFITRGADLLIYFLELGIYYINNNGFVIYITQNSWLDTDFGKKFQSFLLRQTNVKAIIDSDYKYFDGKHGPNINTVISIFHGKTCNFDNEIYFSRYHQNFEKIPPSFLELAEHKQKEYATIKRFYHKDSILEELKWGILLTASSEVLQLISNLKSKGKYLENLSGFDITIGQGLNLVDKKEYQISSKELKAFPILKKGIIPFFTNDDGAKFELLETGTYLADISKFSIQELKTLKKEGIHFFDNKSSKRIAPFLILPRGIGRYFCTINSCSALSDSYVDIYDNSGNLPEENKLNLWLFLNSSVGWLIREISGRKNLGGGMLKAEATDLKSFPLYFDFNDKKRIKSILHKTRNREVDNSLIELETKEHKEIDEIVYNHLSLNMKESELLNEILFKLISERGKKSKT